MSADRGGGFEESARVRFEIGNGGVVVADPAIPLVPVVMQLAETVGLSLSVCRFTIYLNDQESNKIAAECE